MNTYNKKQEREREWENKKDKWGKQDIMAIMINKQKKHNIMTIIIRKQD